MNAYSLAAIAVVAAVTVIACFAYRGRISAKISAFGLKFGVKAENPPPVPLAPAIKADGVTSHSGSVTVSDRTGRGIDAKHVVAALDIALTNEAPEKHPDPK